jgi:hypothetical protein
VIVNGSVLLENGEFDRGIARPDHPRPALPSRTGVASAEPLTPASPRPHPSLPRKRGRVTEGASREREEPAQREGEGQVVPLGWTQTAPPLWLR